MPDNETPTDLDIASIRGVTRLGDLVADDETGEILEWPAEMGGMDRLEWLGRQRAEARAQENAWKSSGAFLAKLVAQLMGDAELERYDGETITIGSTKGRDTRYGDPAALERLEVGPLRYKRAILAAATRLDLTAIRELERTRRLPRGTAEAITKGQLGDPFYQVRTKRRQAPQLEKGIQEQAAIESPTE